MKITIAQTLSCLFLLASPTNRPYQDPIDSVDFMCSLCSVLTVFVLIFNVLSSFPPL